MRDTNLERVVAAGNTGVHLVIIKGEMYIKEMFSDELLKFDNNTDLEVRDSKLYAKQKEDNLVKG